MKFFYPIVLLSSVAFPFKGYALDPHEGNKPSASRRQICVEPDDGSMRASPSASSSVKTVSTEDFFELMKALLQINCRPEEESVNTTAISNLRSLLTMEELAYIQSIIQQNPLLSSLQGDLFSSPHYPLNQTEIDYIKAALSMQSKTGLLTTFEAFLERKKHSQT